MNDDQQIRELIEDWAKAVRDRDVAGIVAHHSDDMLMFDVPVPFQSKGIDAYRKTWETFFRGTEEGRFEISDLHINADTDVAFCTAKGRCSWKNDGKFEELDFRLTVGLKKIDGEWTIVHEHHSVPANP